MSKKFNTVKDTKYRVGNIDIIVILGKGGGDLEHGRRYGNRT